MPDPEKRPVDWQEPDTAATRNRLALTRVLIWAESEAVALGRQDVAEALQEAIFRLHARG